MPFQFPDSAIPEAFRRSAVLIPFWEEGGRIRVLLTRRAERLSRGAGQISFAGGMVDAGETFEEAALREAHEEVGLSPQRVRVLGRLDDAWSRTGSLLVPIVGWLESAPPWQPNPAEVSEIHEPFVDALLDPASHGRETVTHGGMSFTNTVVRWPGTQAYGLSADLLMEALEWGLGESKERGRTRLSELGAYLETQPGTMSGSR